MESDSQPQGPQPPPMATAVAYHPTAQQPAAPRSRGRFVLVLLVLGLCGSLLLNFLLFGVAGVASMASLQVDQGVQEKYLSDQTFAEDKVAVISLQGTILSGEGFIKRQIARAKKDDQVKAIVLRVNSPGGTITGSDSIYRQLCELREQKQEIPIVVSMGGLAASGGYWISMACGHDGVIFAEETTWTGSIGVIIPHYEITHLMANWGVKENSIVSHPLKQTGSFAKAMTPEEEAILKALVEDGFLHFKKVIRKGRKRFDDNPEELDALATGQIYSANQAKDSGLIDKIGSLDDAVGKAIELAGLDKNDVSVVQYCREPNLADLLMGAKADSQKTELAAILDMATPRAYVLCTWLPPLVSSN